jgi:hypothetical protein
MAGTDQGLRVGSTLSSWQGKGGYHLTVQSHSTYWDPKEPSL